MIVGYFDDLHKTISEIYRILKKGGIASFVVGNTRWGGVVVPIDHLLCKIAESVGFDVQSIYVTRLKGNSPQQMKKFGRIPVRESIVNLMK
jgi:ubiquinone/menaquinone biosynthesis C-methylase UbiE